MPIRRRAHAHAVTCLEADVMLGFVEGRLDPDALRRTDAHLASCADCREVIAALASGSEPAADAPVAEGSRVGRYVLLETIGRGAMGVVHAAWDPELDRRIAIKLVRAELGVDAEAVRRRLTREAKAIAKLAHPNVVAVHDVGELADGVFIAMEYVDGTTLAAWRSEARPADEVIAAFAQAARGLAAAHAAGLVHRDVKPSNLLVGRDGRVRVGDFGLARGMGEGGANAGAGAGDPTRTAAGVLAGTPLYMAPEAFTGAAADARSDQYGFAASLYEVLAGVPPFAGRTVDELRRAKASATLVAPVRRVPPRILAALRRALAPDPAARWPAMTALADRLAAHGHRQRRWALVGGVAVVVLAVGGSVAASARQAAEDPCGGGDERIADTWNPVRAAAVTAGAGARAVPTLDAYARAWVADHRRVCEATRVEGEQSEALLDVRMSCLDARRRALGALVEVFATRADPTTRQNAVAAAGALEPVADCDAVTRLAIIAAPPPLQLGAIAAAEARVDTAEALERAGQLADAQAALAAVRGQGYATLTARLELLRGKLAEELGDLKASEVALHAAAQAAAEARDDVTAARAWTLLVGAVGYLDNRPVEGLALAQVADAAVARAGAADALVAELASMRGLVYDAQGKFPEAKAAHERALAIRERLGVDDLEVAQVLDNLGAVVLQQGQLADAARMYTRALAIRRRLLGEEHPDVAASWNSLGAAQRALGQLEDARTSYERASTLFRAELGDAHPNVAAAFVNLGNLERDTHHLDAAEAHFAAAIAIWQKLDAKTYAADIGTATGGLGNVAYARGDRDLAESRLRAALTLLEGALGPAHPRLATQLDNLATIEDDRGHHAAAAALRARATALQAAAGH